MAEQLPTQPGFAEELRRFVADPLILSRPWQPFVAATRVNGKVGVIAQADKEGPDIAAGLSGNTAAFIVLLVNHAEAILALVEVGGELDAAWSDAIDAMDDDNIIPTPLYKRWMTAHREFRAALEALNG